MKAPLVFAGLLLTVVLSAPASMATVDACTLPVAVPGSSSAGGVLVTQTKAHHDGSCWGTGVVGGSWGGVLPCTAAGVYAAPGGGGYCGATFPPSGLATCTWTPVGSSTATTLTVGFDLDGDGHIYDGDGPVYALPPSRTTVMGATVGWEVLNPHSSPARLIAYPTQPGAFQSNTDVHLIDCV